MSVFDQPIVMLDFETTGLSPAMGDRITEVAALRIVDGRVTERYVSLINCNARIPSFITSLTGISQQMVDDAPPVRRVLPELLDFIGSDTLSAHNASFDEKFLIAEADRLGMAPAHQALVCSLKLSRRLFPGHAQLQARRAVEPAGHPLPQRRPPGRVGCRGRRRAAATTSRRHLGRSFGVTQVESQVLVSVNKLSAAKVPAFLDKYASAKKSATAD